LQFLSWSSPKHCGTPALPFSKLHKTVCKPLKKKLLINPTTIGEKLKNKRIELGLTQKAMGGFIGVCEDSITFWEKNRNKPSIIYYPKIIQFLGYVPFDIDASTLGGQIKLYRYLHGLSQEDLALNLDINESTVFHYEKNKHKPSPKILIKFKSLLCSI
jgi:DNA-binding XRE family transcriptional regulator